MAIVTAVLNSRRINIAWMKTCSGCKEMKAKSDRYQPVGCILDPIGEGESGILHHESYLSHNGRLLWGIGVWILRFFGFMKRHKRYPRFVRKTEFFFNPLTFCHRVPELEWLEADLNWIFDWPVWKVKMLSEILVACFEDKAGILESSWFRSA